MDQEGAAARDGEARAGREALQEKLKHLPDKAGVYLLKGAGGEVLYVGKAVSLRHRVRSYFQAARHLTPKIRTLMQHVADLDYIVTDSEVEALILEANLIKDRNPRYNVRLRDDKAYPYLKVTLEEPYPRVLVVRRVRRDGGRYFGPYTNSQALRETLRFLRKLFPIRTCSLDLSGELNYRPCLLYHIQRCAGPCAAKCSEEAYDELIRQACLVLEGRHDKLLPELRQKMHEASERLEFERAARIRDQVRALEKVTERHTLVSAAEEDQDVIGLAQKNGAACVMVFFVRSGKLVGRERFFLESGPGAEPEEVLTAFVEQYYQDAPFVPRQVLLQVPAENPALLQRWLSGRRGGPVELRVPQRGEKRRLVDMVAENAAMVLDERLARREEVSAEVEQGLAELQEALGLPAPPARIEAFDISNLQGREAVASMVVFEDGLPKPGDYRRFRIRTKSTPDDFAMMREVIRRRFLRGLSEQGEGREAGFATFPELVLVDGGKGQLSAAREVMRELGVEDVPTVALAKEEEHLFVEGNPAPIVLPRASQGLYLVQRVRDEAHRFALTYHRHLRDRRTSRSLLDEVPGVGPRRKRVLIQHFGSVEGVRKASVEELARVPGISRDLAERIHLHVR